MRVSSPFNHHVPKGVRENMNWRARVFKKVLDDPSYADVIRAACKKDPLFFINGFTYTYDPRREPFSKIPFILYPFQEEAILDLIKSINSHDILIEKTRDMGASWICIAAIFHCWLYGRDLSFLLGSRVESYVDDPGNPKAMFWKVDYLLDNLPSWLQPLGFIRKQHRRKLHIENPEFGSVIDGESTNENFARGDRRTAIVLDEFAAVEQGHRILRATRDATNSRIFNSTPMGVNNAFYDQSRKSIKKIRLHWSIHPMKNVGLYTTDKSGKLKILDKSGYPEGYIPILDGKMRSPWYDVECGRAASDQEIAQELDIDYLGSGFQFFSADLVRERIREHARPPFLIGDLEYDDETGEPIEFREDPSGNLKLWCLLDGAGKPPLDHKYSAGADVSAGTGASNSALCGWDRSTLSKVWEYANPFIRPEAFAKQSHAIVRFFGSAFLVWESGGPGRQFGSRMMDLGYGNVFLRKQEEAISKKVSDIPGVAQTKETKAQIMGAYRTGIERGVAINRSKEALEETLEYIFGPNDSVVHSRASSKVDPSGAKSNHGDRCMADALAWKGIFERVQKPRKEASSPDIPIGSLAWRQQMREKEKKPKHRELDKSWDA